MRKGKKARNPVSPHINMAAKTNISGLFEAEKQPRERSEMEASQDDSDGEPKKSN